MQKTAKAMILAAGKGTRLWPLSITTPKALAKVCGVSLLEYSIRHLIKHGFSDIIINVHHFAEQIKAFLEENKNFGADITVSDESDMLLNTGGGLKKASYFFNDGKPFIMYNVDIITDLDLRLLYLSHINSGALVTLAVRGRKTSRYFLFDQNNQLCGWKNMATNEIRIATKSISRLYPFAFSGIQVISPSLLEMLKNYEDVFPITDAYIKLCQSYKIIAYNHDKSFWYDLGTMEKLHEAEEILKGNNLLF